MSQISFDNTENAFSYKSTKELKKAQLLFSTMAYPNVAQMGMSLASWVVKYNLPFKGLVKNTIYSQFCGGENLAEISVTTEKYKSYGIDFCLDYGAEGATGEEAFDQTVQEFKKTIEFASKYPNIPFIPIKVTGFAESSLLEKVSAGENLSAEEDAEWKKVYQRIQTVCEMAANHGLKILVDAEESWLQQAVDDLTDDMMKLFNKEKVYIYNTFQLYRHDRLEFIKQSYHKAQNNGYLLGVKIVRGAYMEKERERAQQFGYVSPIQPNKEATDRDYNLAIDYCFQHLEGLSLFIGTHNEYSCLYSVSKLQSSNLPNNFEKVSFSQLFGMSDNITFNLAKEGFNASKYLPYGPVKDVIPYLIRRAQENTSVAGQTGRELFLINKELERRKQIKK